MDALLEVDAGRLVDALAQEGGVDGKLIGGGPARNEGEVLLRDAATLHESAKMAGRRLRFCNQDEAAGLAVEAIDDRDLAAVGDLEGEEVAQEMPQGGGIRGLAGMDLEERGLVDDDPLAGLGDDVQAGRNGSGLRGSGGRGHSAQ